MRIKSYKTNKHQLGQPIREVSGFVRPLAEVHATFRRVPTGWWDFDLITGGGLTHVEDEERGNFALSYLLGAMPGTGKSTLVQQMMAIAGQDFIIRPDTDSSTKMIIGHTKVPKQPLRSLYVQTEEFDAIVKAQSDRMGLSQKNIFVCNTKYTEEVVEAAKDVKPDILVVDSIGCLSAKNEYHAVGAEGGARQLQYISSEFEKLKKRGISIILVGHSTKAGQFQGTQKLKHIVDANCWLSTPREDPSKRVFYFEKNRGARTDIQITWDMTEKGLQNGLEETRIQLGAH